MKPTLNPTLALILALLAASVHAQEAFVAPEFRVIPAPGDIPRIGAVRISCFDEASVEVVRFLQLDPIFAPLPDGRMAFSWTRPPEEWVDGVYTCAASVGKSEDDVPIPSAPVDVIIDIPLQPPVLEVGDARPDVELFVAACSTIIAPHPDLFEHDGMLCWDRGEAMKANPAPGPYTDRLALVRLVR